MNNFEQFTKQWLTALLVCLVLALTACGPDTSKVLAHAPKPDTLASQASGGYNPAMPEGQVLVAASAANAYRCYTVNNCRSNYTSGVPTAQACSELGGNSWTDKNGTCIANIGE
ncbi:hypothetical protein [Desulfovibrio cuneatus]|uniref:hypothetical protein n=1 Tax=Desulfovibrio cuneatus TaxID=159728 RepID=UPI000417E680|nr:hypothetical protein [Desulfovibrio cuneatus]